MTDGMTFPAACIGVKPHLLFNPDSGKYSQSLLQEAVDELISSGMPPSVEAVRNPAEASDCLRRIYDSDDRPFIIVGAGDGTVNAVLNCILPGTATLAVLPMGTSNVFAAELGITNITDGIARILAGRTRPLSAGIIETEGIRRRFLLMAGAGVDGAVVRDVRLPSKRLLKQGAYALSFLRQCLAWDPGTYTVSVQERSLSCHSVIVCNSSRYAGDFILAPASSPFSEGLTMVCITGKSRMAYLKAGLSLAAGRLTKNPLLIKVVTDAVEIPGKMPIQIDGDFIGYGPARITTESDVARIIV